MLGSWHRRKSAGSVRSNGDTGPVADHAEGVEVVNPYAGGGGGSTLGHRVATSYLADMLLGSARPETGELPVVNVAFQTNPHDPVDDLRVEAARNGDCVVVHIAVRRSPQFTARHVKTAKLVGTLLNQIEAFDDNESAYVAVALTGMTNGHREVQRLASLARHNSSEAEFHAQVHEPKRHAGYANRYSHITGLVKKARPHAVDDDLRDLVWSLLNRLWILHFRVESDDETGWVEIGDRLNPLARKGKSGADVRNELHSACATQFDQQGTTVDRPLVRRKIHSVLASDTGRSTVAWEQLDLEQTSAMVAVRHDLGGVVDLPRTKLLTEVQAELSAAGATRGAVLITGESGTGKSALSLSAAKTLAASNRDFQYVALNLRRTRDSVAALSSTLGMPLADLLGELSSPSRVLVVDAADAALEGRGPLLRELAAAAHAAEVGLALVTAETAAKHAAGTLVGIYLEPRRYEVPGLDNAELRLVRDKVPAIAGALRNLPAKSLYRRLAVVDLLARTGTSVSTSLDDWDCLDLIWDSLIGRAASGGSAAARTEALLAMCETELKLPEVERSYPRPDPAALDTLRTDLIVAPEDLRKAEPAFAHDEVRRFATAVRLVRSDSITRTLKASGPMRWSMSAAKLACEGKLAKSHDPNAELAAQMAQFNALGDESTVRWKDVPLEAVLEMPNAYDFLKTMLETTATNSEEVLSTFIRVVSLHQRHNDMIDVLRGEPVVLLIVEEVQELWRRDDSKFQLVSEWLNSALLEGLPAANTTRIALRERLLNYWRAHHPPTATGGSDKPNEERVYKAIGGYGSERRRRSILNWRVTQERYIQLLALLGPDINDDVRACLSKVAADSPSQLQPAVDLGWSAWGLGSYDPGLLLQLTEAYYIDDREGDGGWAHRSGVRGHQTRGAWALTNQTYGPFWVLVEMCRPNEWVPAVNRILDHAATICCLNEYGPTSVDSASAFTLTIDGTERTYVGNGNVWGWYRGGTNGPYPCMSALQAVERWVDRMMAAGAAMEKLATALLDGCNNLAMPGLIVGATIRHLGPNPKAMDPYLIEPLIWGLESHRVTQETIGFLQVPDDGITHPERRRWHLLDIAAMLVLQSSPERQTELKDLGARLLANSARSDVDESTVRRWAAALDADNMKATPADGGVLFSIKEPDDIEEKLAPLRADMARSNVLIGVQNKYWIPPRQQKKDWAPPTPVEIADDLALVKDLHNDPPGFAASDPYLAIACVASASVRSAAAGHLEALGDNASFAITSILGILARAAGKASRGSFAPRFEGDIGTRGSAAEAIPHLLLPELADQLAHAGATADDVAAAAAALGPSAATSTCLKFALGCDIVWAHHCSGDPCIHVTAYKWALDLARLCEIGEFDVELQHHPQFVIKGDVMDRVPQIRPDRLDTSRLSATIRAVGRASSSNACIAEVSKRDLKVLLRAQASAMASQESSDDGYLLDDQGAETVTAARAILHNQSWDDARDDLLLDYIKALVPASHAFSAFLRDLATVGAETQELASAASKVWPTVFATVLNQIEMGEAIYDQSDTFSDYALSHLLPDDPTTAQPLHDEFGQHTFEWVNAEELVEFIPRWLPHAAGRPACLFELIRFLRQLPIQTQLSNGLAWLGTLCLSRADRQLTSYAPMDQWLEKIKPEADARGAGSDWLSLVDRLVYAGNITLAPYSR